MDPSLEREALEVFQEAFDLPPPEQERFVASQCANNPQLLSRVDALLDAARDSRQFPVFSVQSTRLSERTPHAFKTAEDDGDDASHIGPYRLLKQIGEGGMGTVYLAEQVEPVRRRVAVKVVKLGMDSKQVLARFEIERQALAVMSHPAIAKVFDAGTTSRGQPYFVMEHVKGLPITEYCDEHRLSLQDRIQLLQEACRAVQHAHHRGVIHRDLKPSNILVARKSEDEHEVKVIDFGLARSIDSLALSDSRQTEVGQLLGTPEYMSPEQASGHMTHVDTRSDTYSLGVVLYELLTGTQPFPSSSLRAAGLIGTQQILQHVEPSKPSSRIANAAPPPATAASARRLSVNSLRKALERELDWITMHALAKEPDRRYATPNALAEDLQRHRELLPVLAGPPSTIYRLTRLFRRHRTPLISAAAVLVTAIAGGIVSLIFAMAARAKAAENTELLKRLRAFAEAASKDNAPARIRQAQANATEEALLLRAAADLRRMRHAIDAFHALHGRLPLTLHQVLPGDLSDPWGNHYCYLNFDDATGDGLDWALSPPASAPATKGLSRSHTRLAGSSTEFATRVLTSLTRSYSPTERDELKSATLGTHSFSMDIRVPVTTTRRRDQYMFPINTNYDLFSKGPDSRTDVVQGANFTMDDVVTANNGGFIGTFAEY